MSGMASPDDPQQSSGSPAASRRWPTWVFLAMVASPTLIWVLPGRTPAPPPQLPPGWTRLTDATHSLSVDLPAEPTKRGPGKTQYGSTNTAWMSVADGFSYMVTRSQAGQFPPEVSQTPDDMLNGFCDGLKASLEPECSSWQPVTVSGRPGRELRYRGPKSAFVQRFVQIDRTLYFFLVGAPTPDAALDGPDTTHFLDSVRLAN